MRFFLSNISLVVRMSLGCGSVLSIGCGHRVTYFCEIPLDESINAASTDKTDTVWTLHVVIRSIISLAYHLNTGLSYWILHTVNLTSLKTVFFFFLSVDWCGLLLQTCWRQISVSQHRRSGTKGSRGQGVSHPLHPKPPERACHWKEICFMTASVRGALKGV